MRWIKLLLAYNNGMVMSGRYMQEPAWAPSIALLKSGLDKNCRLHIEPNNLGGVINFNETYMDIVDWSYQKIGPLEILFLFFTAGPMYFASLFYADTFTGINPDPFFYNSVVTLFCLPFVFWCSRILWNSLSGCTHYPVRLDRKNQMVHVFRHNNDGGVSSYHWDEISFGLSGGGVEQRGFSTGIMIGYVKFPDGSYEYFRLGVVWPSDEGMYSQWEYFRRYMKEGPQSLPEPDFLLPIDGKRESFRLGAQFCWFLGGPDIALAIFLAPLTVPGSLLRWFFMHVTRSLPRWPQHIVDQCPVSARDKYAYKPRESVNVSCDLAFFVTIFTLAIDYALLHWLIGILNQPGHL